VWQPEDIRVSAYFQAIKRDMSNTEILNIQTLLEQKTRRSPDVKFLNKLLIRVSQHPIYGGTLSALIIYTFIALISYVTNSSFVSFIPSGLRDVFLLIGLVAFFTFLFYHLIQTFHGLRHTADEQIIEGMHRIHELQKISVSGFAKIAEARDITTGKHINRMSDYAKIIAEVMGSQGKYSDYITRQYVEDISIAAPLHDIGKVGISDAILKKAGSLSMNEFEIMKMHTIIGGDLMQEMENQLPYTTFYALGKNIAYHHHQRFDGTGYPNVLNLAGNKAFFVQDGVGQPLKGEDIPLSARIVALADVYDALVSKRVYKEAYPHLTAKRMILDERGRHFDPDVVDAFFAVEERIRNVITLAKD
jgi:HD-GYP domain-containing protein (c-di-GMP phosphodiesterase class II)